MSSYSLIYEVDIQADNYIQADLVDEDLTEW